MPAGRPDTELCTHFLSPVLPRIATVHLKIRHNLLLLLLCNPLTLKKTFTSFALCILTTNNSPDLNGKTGIESCVAQDVVMVDVGKTDRPLFTSERLALDASRAHVIAGSIFTKGLKTYYFHCLSVISYLSMTNYLITSTVYLCLIIYV